MHTPRRLGVADARPCTGVQTSVANQVAAAVLQRARGRNGAPSELRHRRRKRTGAVFAPRG